MRSPASRIVTQTRYALVRTPGEQACGRPLDVPISQQLRAFTCAIIRRDVLSLLEIPDANWSPTAENACLNHALVEGADPGFEDPLSERREADR